MMGTWARIGTISVAQRIATILWLSFLMAGVATGFFFSVIDPLELKYCVDFPEVGRTAAYSIGFFLFWLLTSVSSLLAAFFIYPTKDKDTTVSGD
ncbi:MAG: hypothetical protein DHS20C09_12520 [marine bacterium B5-7]|nr:MAG: hypothetical protein DHS20C09_12520 [marine bacterium B5-7]